MLNTLPKHQKVKSFFPKSSYFRCHGSTLFCVCTFACVFFVIAAVLFFCCRLCAICLFVTNECRKVKFNIMIIVIIISSISCFGSQMFVSLSFFFVFLFVSHFFRVGFFFFFVLARFH